MQHIDYFEGTLQLRDVTKAHLDFVLAQTTKDKRARIASLKKVKGGYDLQFSSNKYLRQMGRLLVAKYQGELKESVRLFSRNRLTQKDIYRLTVMFRPLAFKKGDAIIYKGEHCTIVAVGSHILAKPMSGRKIRIRFSEQQAIRRDSCTHQ